MLQLHDTLSYQLPSFSDPEGCAPVNIDFITSPPSQSFIQLTSTNKFLFTPTQPSHAGTTNVSVTLTDNKGLNST